MARLIDRRQACWGLLLSACLLFGACQYRVGTGSQRQFDSLALLPIQNETLLPQAEALLDSQIRDQLLRAGISIVPESRADVVLLVRLVHFDRELTAVRSDDPDLALSYGLTLRAELTLRDRSGELILEDVPVEITRESLAIEGVQVADYQTLPVMMRDLSLRIRRRVLDRW